MMASAFNVMRCSTCDTGQEALTPLQNESHLYTYFKNPREEKCPLTLRKATCGSRSPGSQKQTPADGSASDQSKYISVATLPSALASRADSKMTSES